MSLSLHHIALRTRDVSGLARFYREVFELTVAREQPGYSVWLALDGAVLMIEARAPGEPDVPPNSMDLTALRVTPDGRERVRETLRQMGVSLEGETAYTTYFRDPDGRRVGVSTYALT